MLQYPIYLLYSLAFLFYHIHYSLYECIIPFSKIKIKGSSNLVDILKFTEEKNSVIIQNDITLNYVIKINHKLDVSFSNSPSNLYKFLTEPLLREGATQDNEQWVYPGERHRHYPCSHGIRI